GPGMPSIDRREFLGATGAVALGALAGCSLPGTGRPPAGSLRFKNDDSLPHVMSVRVRDIGAEVGENPNTVSGNVTAPPSQRDLSASTSLEPGEVQTYQSVFRESAWYVVSFTVDGEVPEDGVGTTVYNPAPEDAENGRFLSGRVTQSGEFTWSIGSTENGGPFTI
ncbi:MAG: hypothetical protein ABEI52_01380, partial [Halobacteriaceae archaeon]